MPPEDRIRLMHMVDAARQAMEFLANRTMNDLESDRMLLFATVRAIEIVGEAGARVTQETRSVLPEIAWTAIVGMRNRLVHAYFDVDKAILWRTVIDELPPLVVQLQHALSSAVDG